MKLNFKSQKGFTLVELGLVMTIAAILLGFSAFNMANVRKITSVNSAIEVLVTDMKNQQTKAMSGFSSTGVNSSHGIYFLTDRYVLFKGSFYLSTESSNFTIKLGTDIEFADNFLQNNSIVFLPQSGEIKDFIENGNKISIQNTGGQNKKTITVNQYGVVTAVE